MKRPESKKDVMKKLGASNYHSKFFPIMHVILTALHNLLHGDNGHKIKVTPLSPKDLIRFDRNYKQEQYKRQKKLANSSALLNNADVHSDDDDDDDNIGIGSPTQTELQCVQPELLKSADNQSSPNINTLCQLQHTDLSINSRKMKIAQKYPLTFVFVTDPNKYHDFMETNYIKHNSLGFEKTEFVLEKIRTWLSDPWTPKFQRKNPTSKSNTALSHYFDRLEPLLIEDDSDLLHMTTYSEFRTNLLSKRNFVLF